MTVNKKILAVAILGGLFAGTAQAAVDISAATPAPAVFADEAVVDATSGLHIENAGGAIDLVTSLQYSFSDAEVRHARIECSDNMVFDAGSTATVGVDGTVGAINGIGTSAIHFSITAATAPDPANLEATDTITVTGNRNVSSTDAVTCTYGLYDTPSQAAQGGTDGLIASDSGPYLTFGPTYGLIVDATYTNVADVEADPAFSEYTVDTAGSSDMAAIGDYHFDLSGNLGGVTPLNPVTGLVFDNVSLGVLLGDDTALVFGGDFSLAVDAEGNPDPDKVFLSTDGCLSKFAPLAMATELTAASATFVIGPFPHDEILCYQSAGGVAIPVSDYTVSLDAQVKGTAFVAPDIAPRYQGSIIHNGTELQAPLAQLPGSGWLSRMVLTNTGDVDRAYTIEVIGEDGNTISTGDLTGTVLADSVLVVDLDDVMTDATGKLRGTLNVTVAGPDKQIQGMFQIVNSVSGSISNHVMVRPGKN